MGYMISATTGYGFRVPAAVLDRLSGSEDYEGFDEWADAHLSPLLCYAMAYAHDYYDEEPYAIIVERSSNSYHGAHVHQGHMPDIGLSDSELDAFLKLFKELKIDPTDISLGWLTIISLG
jgi:hypothetical protein